MRTKDTSLMEDIISQIDTFYLRYGRVPSTRELAEVLPLSHNRIAQYLRDMCEKGMLEYVNGKIVTEKMTKLKSSVAVPILGSISCGMPLMEEENIEAYAKLPEELVGHGEYFFLKANGDSMKGAGIRKGEYVLIRKTTEANEGDIVVALIDGENTLKRLKFDKVNHKVVLHPENEEFDDIVVDYCEIQGVAVKVLKDLPIEP